MKSDRLCRLCEKLNRFYLPLALILSPKGRKEKQGAESPSVFLPMLTAFAGFTAWTVGDACVRAVNDYPVFVIAFLSSATTVFWLLALSPFLGGMRQTLTRPRLKMRIFRGAVIAAASFLAYATFMYLDMATAYAIIFIAPLLAKILSVILTGERIRLRSWLITGLGFAGVLIVLRPGWVPLNTGTLSALGLAFFFALGFILSRYIRPGNQTILSLGLFQYVFVMLGTAYPAFLAWQEMSGITLPDLIRIMTVGSMAVIGSLGVSYGYANGPSATIAPIHYTQILFGTLWGALFFGEYPDFWTLAGGVVIIGAGLLLIRYSRRPVP